MKHTCSSCEHSSGRAGRTTCKKRSFSLWDDDGENYRMMPFFINEPEKVFCEDYSQGE